MPIFFLENFKIYIGFNLSSKRKKSRTTNEWDKSEWVCVGKKERKSAKISQQSGEIYYMWVCVCCVWTKWKQYIRLISRTLNELYITAIIVVCTFCCCYYYCCCRRCCWLLAADVVDVVDVVVVVVVVVVICLLILLLFKCSTLQFTIYLPRPNVVVSKCICTHNIVKQFKRDREWEKHWASLSNDDTQNNWTDKLLFFLATSNAKPITN